MSSQHETRDVVIAFYNGIAQRDYETLGRLGRHFPRGSGAPKNENGRF